MLGWDDRRRGARVLLRVGTMPPGEEEGGGRPRGGRAEGGAPNPGGGFEGQRGREAGSVGGEGGGAGGAGLGTRPQGARVGRERRGMAREEDRRGPAAPSPACALLSSSTLLLKSFPPRLPSLFSPGLEPQTLRHSFSCWRGRRSNCKTFRRTSPRGETWAAARPGQPRTGARHRLRWPDLGRQHPLHLASSACF